MKIEVELPEGPDWVRETLQDAMSEALQWTDKRVLARDGDKRLVVQGPPEPTEAILGRLAATRDLILALEGRYEGLIEERQRALEGNTEERPEA